MSLATTMMSSGVRLLDYAEEPLTVRPAPEEVFAAGLRHHHIANTAYPIAHTKTIWSFRRKPALHEQLIRESFSRSPAMSLYIHLPFCERRCSFCEYCVLDRHSEEDVDLHHDALLREIEMYGKRLGLSETPLRGMDIGGGTPALVSPKRITEILRRVAATFRTLPEFGISIETTPKVAALYKDRMSALRKMGIDRISMGLQSPNPRLLREYGRDLNRVGYNRRAVDNIRAAGFRRFNIDLMYGFARQEIDDVRRAARYVSELRPEVITLYRMRYKGTRIADEAPRISRRKVMEMSQAASAELASAGYHAAPGKNGYTRLPGDSGASEYLTARVVHSVPYLGLGLGAQTFANNLLAYNHGAATKRLDRYLASVSRGELPIQDLYHLPKSEGMAKMISVAFYFGAIHLGAFRYWFGRRLEEQFQAEVDFVLERGLMIYDGSFLRLTKAGATVSNGVIALFYSDRVKAHLLNLAATTGADR